MIVPVAILVLCIVSLAVGFKKRSLPISVGALACSLLFFSFYSPLFPAPKEAPGTPPFPYNVRDGQFFVICRSTQTTEENAIFSGVFFLDMSGNGLWFEGGDDISPSQLLYEPVWTKGWPWTKVQWTFSSSSKAVSVVGRRVEIFALGTFTVTSRLQKLYYWNLPTGTYPNFSVRVVLDFDMRKFSFIGKAENGYEFPELILLSPEAFFHGLSPILVPLDASFSVLAEHYGSYSLKAVGSSTLYPGWYHYFYIASGIPLSAPQPPQPISPPITTTSLELLLNYSISSYAFSDGILVSVDAAFVDGSFLPDGTTVSLLSPIKMDLIQAEKDEWICQVPLEYQGANGILQFNVPGYLPKTVNFIITPSPVQERADLHVYLFDRHTENLAQGSFTVSVDGTAKTGNPCIFEGVLTQVTISVSQISGDVKYYPAQETVSLSPWSSNTVNIYLERKFEVKSGTASISVRVYPQPPPTSVPSLALYFAGKKVTTVWNPSGYWEATIENVKGGESYSITATCSGYESQTIVVTPEEGKTTLVSIYLSQMPPVNPENLGILDVAVVDRATKIPLAGAKVILSDGRELTTNEQGRAVFYNTSEGDYTVTAILEGYFDVTKKTTVKGGMTTTLTINLSSYLFVAKEEKVHPERILLLLLLIFIASGVILVWRRR